AIDLATEVIAGLAEIAEANRLVVDLVKRGDDRVHGVVDRPPLAFLELGQGRVPENAALDVIHDVESGADDVVVEAKRIAAGDRHAGVAKGGDDPVLAIDGVRGGEQLPRRLPPQHVALLAGGQAKGRVRLPAAELLDRKRS